LLVYPEEAKLFPMTHLILFGNLTVNELCQTFIFQWGQLFWKYLMFDLTIDSLLTKLCNFFFVGHRSANPSGHILSGYNPRCDLCSSDFSGCAIECPAICPRLLSCVTANILSRLSHKSFSMFTVVKRPKRR